MAPRPLLEGISSGCVAVDAVAGNSGFPRGRVSEIFGMEQSGKSTLCMTACAKAQRSGLYAVYIDVERGLDPLYATNLGFDLSIPGCVFSPDTFEETLTVIDTMAQQGEADLILVDSAPALVPEAVMKGDITEMGQFGQNARLFAGALPRLVKTIERTKTALVFTNQLRANIPKDAYSSRYEPKEKTSGGYALRFYSSLRIELRQLDKDYRTREVPHPTELGKTDKEAVASLHQATVFKSKVAQPYKNIKFQIRFDPKYNAWGIDNLQTRIDLATVKGLITVKAGGFYTYTTKAGELQSIRGEDTLYDWFQQRPDEVAHLRDQLGV